MYINLISNPSASSSDPLSPTSLFKLHVPPHFHLHFPIVTSNNTMTFNSHVKVATWQLTNGHHFPINFYDTFTMTNNGLLLLLLLPR